jgi:hypothetical protein
MLQPAPALSRRNFLTQASCFGAFYHLAARVPLLGLSSKLADDSRISAAPIVDKGFASVRKIGDGLYATISDPSKGYVTVSNGGFLVGKDSAILLEGFASVPGAAFQMETLRTVTQIPVKAALDTHYHYDHSCGNAFYGAHGVELWVTPPSRVASSTRTRRCSRWLPKPLSRHRKLASAKRRPMWKKPTRKAISTR